MTWWRLRRARATPWTPYMIPLGLKYSEFDFERTPQITVATGISSFVDPVTTAAFVQGTAASQPLLDPTGFNGRPCGVFDGTDDFLRNATALATLGWPASGAFEVWALLDINDVSGTYFAYPNTGTGGLTLQHAVLSGIRTVRALVGTGSAIVTVLGPETSAVGKHIIRFVSDGAASRIEMDGVSGTPVAAVPSFSGGPRNTIGGTAASTPGGYFSGKMNFLGMYRPLPADYATNLYANLNTRRGV